MYKCANPSDLKGYFFFVGPNTGELRAGQIDKNYGELTGEHVTLRALNLTGKRNASEEITQYFT